MKKMWTGVIGALLALAAIYTYTATQKGQNDQEVLPTVTPAEAAATTPAATPTPTLTLTPTPEPSLEVAWQRGPVTIGDYTYSSQSGHFIGLFSQPPLSMDVVEMSINLEGCNAYLRVVWGVSTIQYRGEPLEFRLTTETVSGPLLARFKSLYGEWPRYDLPSMSRAVVTMDEYDHVAEELGLPVYAEAYGESNPSQHLAAMRCREAIR